MKVKIKKLGKKIDEKRLKELEEKYSFIFPDQYREFMLEYNGGVPEPDAINFVDIHRNKNTTDIRCLTIIDYPEYYHDFEYKMNTFIDRIPDNFIPIAYDSRGNLILLSCKGKDKGCIYFWDHDYEAADGYRPTYDNLSFVSDSFNSFLDSLYHYD